MSIRQPSWLREKELMMPEPNTSTFACRYRVADIAAFLVLIATFSAAAHAGADTTFTPALTKFTDFLEGSGGKIITVLSLAGGVIGMASGRFALGQIAVPVGVGVGVGTGIPIVTAAVTATI
jgi:conjugal transfer pilus assembly protein TraA